MRRKVVEKVVTKVGFLGAMVDSCKVLRMPLTILNLLPKGEMDLRRYPKLKNRRPTFNLHRNQNVQSQWMTVSPHRESRRHLQASMGMSNSGASNSGNSATSAGGYGD
jgi:hypothetical protein